MASCRRWCCALHTLLHSMASLLTAPSGGSCLLVVSVCVSHLSHRYLDSHGYAISTYGFSGPFLNLGTIQDGSMLSMNLYCVRKDLRQAQLAHKAGVTAPKKP